MTTSRSHMTVSRVNDDPWEVYNFLLKWQASSTVIQIGLSFYIMSWKQNNRFENSLVRILKMILIGMHGALFPLQLSMDFYTCIMVFKKMLKNNHNFIFSVTIINVIFILVLLFLKKMLKNNRNLRYFDTFVIWSGFSLRWRC